MKKVIIVLVALVVLLLGIVIYFLTNGETEGYKKDSLITATSTDETLNDNTDQEDDKQTVLGTSVNGREITAYHYGSGEDRLVFVGGIHGGYSWNTAAVAYEMMDYLEKNPQVIPDNVRVTVIPVLNPDGLKLVVNSEGKFDSGTVSLSEAKKIGSRLNQNSIDLNRNFDCDWQANGTWQNKTVSGGTEAFSEPESKAFRDFIASSTPKAVVVWYSAAGGVFASSCHGTVLSETNDLTKLFAKASGYKAYEEFDFYEITGDMVNWLAKKNIPAISVLLATHNQVEWDQNRKGIEAVFDYYKKQ